MSMSNERLAQLGIHDYRGKVVLITGGTRGIGLATGLAYGRLGAHVVLTHKWGSADEDEIKSAFTQAGAPEPMIAEADAGSPEDTQSLVETIREKYGRLDVFVSNVAFAQIVKNMDDYQKRALLRSIDYSVWPMVEYTKQIHAVFGAYPRYVIGLSSIGPDKYTANYDFVASSKSVMETLCRYLAFRLGPEGVRVNVVRAALVRTESLEATMGPECVPFIERFDKTMFVTVEEVANTILALTSGLMDAMNGQVVSVDHGAPFYDNIMRLYGERDKIHLKEAKREGK
jgi:NAD(P)-dependent dehydrogenase (short-subunit alcohol dehydrogenase family)